MQSTFSSKPKSVMELDRDRERSGRFAGVAFAASAIAGAIVFFHASIADAAGLVSAPTACSLDEASRSMRRAAGEPMGSRDVPATKPLSSGARPPAQKRPEQIVGESFLERQPVENASPGKGESSCTNDDDCGQGFSCWHRIPRGPSQGIRGSEENPGRCWHDAIRRQTY